MGVAERNCTGSRGGFQRQIVDVAGAQQHRGERHPPRRPRPQGRAEIDQRVGGQHQTLDGRRRGQYRQAAGDTGGRPRIAQAQHDFGARAPRPVIDDLRRVGHRIARTAQRHVMHQPVAAAKTQHLNRFGAQEGHARRIGLDVGEVAAQVRAHLVQNRGHCSPDGVMVRFAPESASKTASFVVSNANSIDCPIAALDSAGTLATNWFSCASDSAASSSS